MEKKDQGTLGAYIDLFLRRKFLLLGVFAVLFLLLGAGALSVKTSYRARSLLAIGESESLAMLSVDPRGRSNNRAANASLSGKTYATIVEGLPMADLVARGMSDDSLNVSPGFIHRAVRAEFYEPELLEISATAKDPEHAKLIANATAETFIEYNRAQIRGELQESVNFVQRELENVKRELQVIQSQIGEFKTREGVTDLDVETEELLGAVTEFEKDRMLAEADLAEREAQFQELNAHLYERIELDLSPLEDPAVRGLVQHLTELQIELELARVEYGPDHPKRKLLEQQVSTTEQNLDTAMAGGVTAGRCCSRIGSIRSFEIG